MLVDCADELFLTLLRTSVAAKESLRDAIFAVTGQKYGLGPYNPDKYTVAKPDTGLDPLAGLLKKASELGGPGKKRRGFRQSINVNLILQTRVGGILS